MLLSTTIIHIITIHMLYNHHCILFVLNYIDVSLILYENNNKNHFRYQNNNDNKKNVIYK